MVNVCGLVNNGLDLVGTLSLIIDSLQEGTVDCVQVDFINTGKVTNQTLIVNQILLCLLEIINREHHLNLV